MFGAKVADTVREVTDDTRSTSRSAKRCRSSTRRT
jgi:hypothetical protein